MNHGKSVSFSLPSSAILLPMAEVRHSAQLRFKRCAINPDGSISPLSDWHRNLILDVGLNGLPTAFVWANATRYCAKGTSTNPFKRDSGAVTFTSAGNTLTASSNFFEAGDVNRLFKPDAGTEVYITGYTSPTEVTTAADPGAVASEGTIYYVNRTGLGAETERTNTVRTQGGDNGRSWSDITHSFTYRRTHLFPAEVAPTTYRELGWSWQAAGNLFSGVVLPGGGDSLAIGQQYMVISELIVAISPFQATAQANVGSGGWDTTGQIAIEYTNISSSSLFSRLDGNGNALGDQPGETNLEAKTDLSTQAAYLQTTDVALNTPITNGDSPSPVGVNPTSATRLGYGAGNLYRDSYFVWGVNVANGTVYGITYGGFNKLGLTVKFTTPQVKDAEHEVRATFRISWGRVLVN